MRAFRDSDLQNLLGACDCSLAQQVLQVFGCGLYQQTMPIPRTSSHTAQSVAALEAAEGGLQEGSMKSPVAGEAEEWDRLPMLAGDSRRHLEEAIPAVVAVPLKASAGDVARKAAPGCAEQD